MMGYAGFLGGSKPCRDVLSSSQHARACDEMVRTALYLHRECYQYDRGHQMRVALLGTRPLVTRWPRHVTPLLTTQGVVTCFYLEKYDIKV